MTSRRQSPLGNARKTSAGLGVFILLTTVVLAACSSSPTPTPTSTPTPEDNVAAGARLFREKGCATCHGQNAEGTGVAPALPGHAEEQVLRQVRNPVGCMPAFSMSQISDEELEQLADYIVSPGSGDGHNGGHMEPVDMGHDEMVEMHHWMALESMQVNNVAEADHHIGHIMDLTDDPEHLHLMQEISDAMHAGNMHDAEHLMEDLLVDRVMPSLDIPHLHAQMAMGAIDIDDVMDARHHLQHIVDQGGDSEIMGMARSATMSLDAGDMDATRSMIESMIGMGMGTDSGMGM